MIEVLNAINSELFAALQDLKTAGDCPGYSGPDQSDENYKRSSDKVKLLTDVRDQLETFLGGSNSVWRTDMLSTDVRRLQEEMKKQTVLITLLMEEMSKETGPIPGAFSVGEPIKKEDYDPDKDF